MRKRDKIGFGIGFVLAGCAVGATVAAATIVKRRANEKVFREAEIRAMEELDELKDDDMDCENICCEPCDACEQCELDTEEESTEKQPEIELEDIFVEEETKE